MRRESRRVRCWWLRVSAKILELQPGRRVTDEIESYSGIQRTRGIRWAGSTEGKSRWTRRGKGILNWNDDGGKGRTQEGQAMFGPTVLAWKTEPDGRPTPSRDRSTLVKIGQIMGCWVWGKLPESTQKAKGIRLDLTAEGRSKNEGEEVEVSRGGISSSGNGGYKARTET